MCCSVVLSLRRLPLHLSRVLAENIVRTVETLAAQKRVLVCPICDRRLVQIEQMVDSDSLQLNTIGAAAACADSQSHRTAGI